MPTMLDVVRKLREERRRLGAPGLLIASLAGATAALVVLVLLASTSLAALNRLFGLELELFDPLNMLALFWLWLLLRTARGRTV